MLYAIILLLLSNQGFSHGAGVKITTNVGKCLVVGETFELNCSINNWDENNEPDLQLLRITHTRKRLTAVNTSVVDNRTVHANIPNVGIYDSGRYECCYKSSCKLAYSVLLKVEEPDTIPDFDCIANGLETKVNCTWTSHDQCSTWRLLFHSNSDGLETECVLPRHKVPQRCAKSSIDSNRYSKTQCRIPFEGKPLEIGCQMDLYRSNYTLRLERISPFGIDTRIIEWLVRTNVKIDPVQNLKVKQTSTTFSVDWTFQTPLSCNYHGGSSCVVTCGDEKKILEFHGKANTYHVTGVLFDGLRPFTEYNISVMCKCKRSRYWGDPIEQSFFTEEDVPLLGPATTNHSYTLSGCKTNKSATCLSIYSKTDAINANGDICGHEVRIRSSAKPSLHQWFNISSITATLEIGPLDRMMLPPYEVSIWSKTSKGLSIRSTDIFINPNKVSDNDVAVGDLLVEEEDTYFLLSARASGSTPSHYIFHWCYGYKPDVETVTCKDGYGYRNSSSPELRITQKELNGPDVCEHTGDHDRWHFGVSVSGRLHTTGIHWEDCTFVSAKHVRPPSQPEKPLLSDGSDDKIVVDVQSFCPSDTNSNQGIRPMNYTIVCVNNDDPPHKRTETFQARYKHDRFEIDNLKPGTTYNVKYNIGYRRSISPYSESATKYINPKQNIKIVVGIAVGITLIFLIGFLMIVKFIIWYKNIEQPIEGVEINKNNESKFHCGPKCFSDGSCTGSQNSEDATGNMVIGINKGDLTFHCPTDIPREKSCSKNIRISCRDSGISNPSDRTVDLNSNQNSENTASINEELSPKKTPTPEYCPWIAEERSDNMSKMPGHSSVTTHATRNGTWMCSRTIHSRSVPRSDEVSESQYVTGYIPMNERCNMTPAQENIAVTSQSTTANDDVNDGGYSSMCAQQIEDYIAMHVDILPYIDEQSPHLPNGSFEETELPRNNRRYTQLPKKESIQEIMQNESRVSPKSDESDDDITTIKTDTGR